METEETFVDQNLPPQPQQAPQPPPPPPPPPPAAAPPAAPTPSPPPNTSTTRKRPLDDSTTAVRLENSPYYKMRAIFRDLRPHFIEAIRTPDLQNCKAAEEIREKMKIFMDLYKEMIAEPPIPENVPASHPSSGEIKHGHEYQTDMKPPPDRAFTRHVETKTVFSGSISQKQQPLAGRPEGTYVVGGSAFGWNFVTFPGTTAIYYGRTKESFRSANAKSQVE